MKAFAFSGVVTPVLAKHSRSFALIDCIAVPAGPPIFYYPLLPGTRCAEADASRDH
jgi:hypothetical protein